MVRKTSANYVFFIDLVTIKQAFHNKCECWTRSAAPVFVFVVVVVSACGLTKEERKNIVKKMKKTK